jgi:hypothetical protein
VDEEIQRESPGLSRPGVGVCVREIKHDVVLVVRIVAQR